MDGNAVIYEKNIEGLYEAVTKPFNYRKIKELFIKILMKPGVYG